jgi:RNA recognition motif-containing protein
VSGDSIKENKSVEQPKKKSKSKSNRPRFKRERGPDDISPADSIFISNISSRTSKEDLAEFLKDLKPEWTHISFKRVFKEGRSFLQFFGFAKFKDTETQQKAIAEFNGKKLGNRTVYVSVVLGKKKESDVSSKNEESKAGDYSKETKPPKAPKGTKETKTSAPTSATAKVSSTAPVAAPATAPAAAPAAAPATAAPDVAPAPVSTPAAVSVASTTQS